MVQFAPLYAIVDKNKEEFYENIPRSTTRKPAPAIYSTLVGARCACARLNKQHFKELNHKPYKVVQIIKLILVEMD
jgi:hypothetical protein